MLGDKVGSTNMVTLQGLSAEDRIPFASGTHITINDGILSLNGDLLTDTGSVASAWQSFKQGVNYVNAHDGVFIVVVTRTDEDTYFSFTNNYDYVIKLTGFANADPVVDLGDDIFEYTS